MISYNGIKYIINSYKSWEFRLIIDIGRVYRYKKDKLKVIKTILKKYFWF